MNKLFISLFTFASVLDASAQTPGTYQFAKRKGSHTARIAFRTRAFDPKKHNITYSPVNYQTTIDGRLAYGAESVPRTEIVSVEFYLDGKRIVIPRRLYSDCYEPNIEYGKDSVGIRFSRAFQRVFVEAAGADGAGTYRVVWVLARNGRHRRYFKETF